MKDIEKKENYRHEFKYLCTNNQLALLNAKLKIVMKVDENAGESSTYRIRSIYFDDLNNSKYYENENGISPREKWRIRAYNEDPSNISLECKRKENDKIIKKSCRLTYDQYNDIISGNTNMSFHQDSKLLNRFLILMKTTQLKPKVIVGYERKPFICKEGNVRVTFDMNIFSSPDIDKFFDKKLRKRQLMPKNTHMIEVKYDEYLPDYINETILMTNMNRITFSKYYYSRKYSIVSLGTLTNQYYKK